MTTTLTPNVDAKTGKAFSKFFKLVKVDEARREVGGTVTAEVVDKDGETCHYESTKPYYEAWSGDMLKASDGKNCGNLREMHGLSAAGVGKSIEFDDDNRAIHMTFKVVDDAAWNKVQEGVYTGFSQGGDYVKNWTEGKKKYYTAQPSEVSLVDNPCLGAATFDFIRVSGQVEVRKFKATGGNTMEKVEAVSSVISIDQVSQMIDSALEKQKREGREAAEAQARLAARKIKVSAQVGELIKKIEGSLTTKVEKTGGKVRKNIYAVKQLAGMLEDLAYMRISATYEREYEQDGSKLPEKLQADLEQIAETFLTMAEEEVEELKEAAAEAGNSKPGGMYMSIQAGSLEKAAQKSLADHLGKMAACVTDHHTKVAKLHKDHADEMHGHMQKLHKILGTEEADADNGIKPSGSEPHAVDPKAGAAESFGMPGKAASAEEIQKMIDAAVKKAGEDAENRVIDAFVKALSPDEDEALAKRGEAVVEAKPGIGDRDNTPARKGAQIRTMPVTKAADVAEPAAAAAVDPATIDMEKVRRGDVAEIRKFMTGVKPGEVPPTIVDRLSAGGAR